MCKKVALTKQIRQMTFFLYEEQTLFLIRLKSSSDPLKEWENKKHMSLSCAAGVTKTSTAVLLASQGLKSQKSEV